MRYALLGALLLATAACGGYEFPGQIASPAPEVGAVGGRVIAVPCGPIEPAPNSCAGRTVPGLEIDYVGAACQPCKAITDAQGNYSTELPPGDYNVKLKTYMRVISGPLKLSIAPGVTTTADYVLDTGIRAPTA
jgi:hypothetical protein